MWESSTFTTILSTVLPASLNPSTALALALQRLAAALKPSFDGGGEAIDGGGEAVSFTELPFTAVRSLCFLTSFASIPRWGLVLLLDAFPAISPIFGGLCLEHGHFLVSSASCCISQVKTTCRFPPQGISKVQQSPPTAVVYSPSHRSVWPEQQQSITSSKVWQSFIPFNRSERIDIQSKQEPKIPVSSLKLIFLAWFWHRSSSPRSERTPRNPIWRSSAWQCWRGWRGSWWWQWRWRL